MLPFHCGELQYFAAPSVIRIRMQLDSEGGGAKVFRSPVHCATTIAKEQGLKGIYAGLEAGVFRQVVV